MALRSVAVIVPAPPRPLRARRGPRGVRRRPHRRRRPADRPTGSAPSDRASRSPWRTASPSPPSTASTRPRGRPGGRAGVRLRHGALRGGPGGLPPGPRPRRLGALGLLRRVPAGRGRPAGRALLHHPLAAHRGAARPASPRPRSTPTCCSSRTTAWSPAPAPRPGIDACLHHVRCELGAAVANRIARRMVVPPQRDGGQRQYIDLPVPDCSADSLAPLLTWMREHLAEEQTVRTLARRAAMSERTFARRFAAETGTTPGKWLLAQRLQHARRCWRAATCRSRPWRPGPGSGRPPCCATTSACTSASRPRSTAARSARRTPAPAETCRPRPAAWRAASIAG